MSSLYFPGPSLPPASPVIGPMSAEALFAQAFVFANWGAPASAAWPSANRAVGYPFILPEPRTLLQMYVQNGATASGNLDMGVYRPDGTKLVSMGATAQSGTSAIQLLDVTDTVLPAHTLLYVWLAVDNTTATVVRWTAGANIGQIRATGIVQMASAYPLPSTITPAAVSTSHLPDFGMVFASVV